MTEEKQKDSQVGKTRGNDMIDLASTITVYSIVIDSFYRFYESQIQTERDTEGKQSDKWVGVWLDRYRQIDLYQPIYIYTYKIYI